MRSFMRAIGLGGLFRRHRHPSPDTSAALRAISIHDAEYAFSQDLLKMSNENEFTINESIVNPPPFVLYGGSDRDTNVSLGLDLTAHQASYIDYNTIQPQIQHRMPVFFAPPPRRTLRQSIVCNYNDYNQTA